MLLAVIDGLKGFPGAIWAVFSEPMVQTCIVHLLRHSLNFVSSKDRKALAVALKDIYRALNAAAGEAALAAFEAGELGRKYPATRHLPRKARADYGDQGKNRRCEFRHAHAAEIIGDLRCRQGMVLNEQALITNCARNRNCV